MQAITEQTILNKLEGSLIDNWFEVGANGNGSVGCPDEAAIDGVGENPLDTAQPERLTGPWVGQSLSCYESSDFS